MKKIKVRTYKAWCDKNNYRVFLFPYVAFDKMRCYNFIIKTTIIGLLFW